MIIQSRDGESVTRQAWQFLELQAEVLQAVAQPVRLAIVQALADGELCVCDIAETVGAKRSNVSRHLSVMTRAGVLDVRRDGARMIYRLAAPCIMDFLSCVTNIVRSRIEGQAVALATP